MRRFQETKTHFKLLALQVLSKTYTCTRLLCNLIMLLSLLIKFEFCWPVLVVIARCIPVMYWLSQWINVPELARWLFHFTSPALNTSEPSLPEICKYQAYTMISGWPSRDVRSDDQTGFYLETWLLPQTPSPQVGSDKHTMGVFVVVFCCCWKIECLNVANVFNSTSVSQRAIKHIQRMFPFHLQNFFMEVKKDCGIPTHTPAGCSMYPKGHTEGLHHLLVPRLIYSHLYLSSSLL